MLRAGASAANSGGTANENAPGSAGSATVSITAQLSATRQADHSGQSHERLDLRDRVQAVVYAHRRGLVT
ncbi:hypothetical protein GCM10027280_05550 [Micromonospora polyrhachis]